jgi:hypothetical protein
MSAVPRPLLEKREKRHTYGIISVHHSKATLFFAKVGFPQWVVLRLYSAATAARAGLAGRIGV